MHCLALAFSMVLTTAPQSDAVTQEDVEQSAVARPSAPAVAIDAPRTARAMRVAVYDLQVVDLEPQLGRIVTDSLLLELRKLERMSVIGMDEVRAMLDHEAQRQLVGCDAEESCLAEIASALGVDVLVVGNLARVNGQHVFGIKRIDQRTAKVDGQFVQRLEPGNGEEFLAVIGPAIEQVFADHALRPGAVRGVSEEMALRLNPPPLPIWAFYSSVGVTGAALLTGMGGGIAFALTQADYDATTRAALESGNVLSGATLKDKERLVTTSAIVLWSGLAAAGVAAGATTVVGLFTDWDGYRDGE